MFCSFLLDIINEIISTTCSKVIRTVALASFTSRSQGGHVRERDVRLCARGLGEMPSEDNLVSVEAEKVSKCRN